jgi:hypothetical protein
MKGRGNRALRSSERLETPMQEAQDRSDLETFAAVIADSQIIVAGPVKRLPAGFDDIDIAILDWIAAEGRRAVVLGRRLASVISES